LRALRQRKSEYSCGFQLICPSKSWTRNPAPSAVRKTAAPSCRARQNHSIAARADPEHDLLAEPGISMHTDKMLLRGVKHARTGKFFVEVVEESVYVPGYTWEYANFG
jgi:hypothetical protein